MFDPAGSTSTHFRHSAYAQAALMQQFVLVASTVFGYLSTDNCIYFLLFVISLLSRLTFP